MRRIFALLLAAVLAGCGGSGSTDAGGGSVSQAASASPVPVASQLPSPTPSAAVSPIPQTATVVVRFQLLRAVPQLAQTFVVRGTDSSGQVLYGPFVYPRQSPLVLNDVPVGVTHILIDYDFQDTVLARADIPVTLTVGGSYPIDDPDFTVVTQPTAVTLSPANASLNSGSSLQYTATISFSNQKSYPASSSQWSTDNPQVASVSSTGLVSAARAGSVNVTAQFLGLSGSALLTVSSPQPGLVVVPANAELNILSTQNFGALLQQPDGSTLNVTSNVTWTTSNPLVAVYRGGLTAVGGGSASLVASYQGISGSANISVAGPALSALSVSPSSYLMVPLQTLQLTANGVYADGSQRNLSSLTTWTSPPSVGIDGSGLATALAVGEGTISASLGPLSAGIPGQVRTPDAPFVPPFTPPPSGPVTPPAASPSPSPSPAAGTGRLYVINIGANLLGFAPATTASGNLTPTTMVDGGATTLMGVSGLFIDPLDNRAWLADEDGIKSYTPASTSTGNLPPTQAFSVTGGGLSDVYYDHARDLLFSLSSDGVRMFDAAAALNGGTLSGNRQLSYDTEFRSCQGMTYDPVNDRLYVSINDYSGSDSVYYVEVYNGASSLNGAAGVDVMPVNTLSSLSYPQHMALNTATQRLYISDADTVTIFDNPISASTPSARLTSFTSDTGGVALDATCDELYVGVGGEGDGSVLVFSGASALSGSVSSTALAVRTIVGDNTQFTGISGVALDLTR